MTSRPTSETIEGLRLTLLRLEQTPDSGYDETAISKLKHILLARIAELEAQAALVQHESAPSQSTEPSSVVSGPTPTEHEAAPEPAAPSDLSQLD